MEDKVLSTVKRMLGPGITDDCTVFDDVLITHTNSVLSTLYQLGVGPKGGVRITSGSDTWSDLFDDDPRIDFVKTYVGLKVRMLFDPPTAGTALDALQRDINEYEWRINVAVDPDEG